ncbi:MAG: altronate dehydratase family protein [Candidatus Dormiibacterota bacterium]
MAQKTPATPLTMLGRASAVPSALAEVAVKLHPDDQVAIAKRHLVTHTRIRLDDGTLIELAQTIPSAHKFALTEVPSGAAVHRYGQIIGFATQPIAAGEHVHTHNLAVRDFERDYAFSTDLRPVDYVPETERRTFLGYRRPDGRVGTRNYVAVLASVNCSSSATRAIADHFRYGTDLLQRYPNVDGVLGLATKGGCGAHHGSADVDVLQRTMAGIVDHPNVAAYVILSLGCEVNQPDEMIDNTGLGNASRPRVITIQEDGGYRETVKAGIEAVQQLLPVANEARREPIPASELVVALQCGGSDAWSGVTANPALGRACDLLVAQGGTIVLGETTEVYGGEHLLTRRARTPEIGRQLVDCIHWWERYTASNGAEIDNNPSPGNKAGGLTTIYEKSLGAIAKAGTTPLNQVVGYGERVTERGFVHMDTPGYDPVSATGQVAGGCNLVVFTTGRGSAFGFKPSPSIKLASNSELFRKQEPDMDIDTGRVLEGVPLDVVAEEIVDRMLAVASGTPSKSEAEGIGEEEFNPWIRGETL